MSCGSLGLLWPRPTGAVELSKDLIRLYPEDVSFILESQVPKAPGRLLAQAQAIFKTYLRALFPEKSKVTSSGKRLQVRISVSSPSIDLNPLETDERYSLTLNSTTEGSLWTAHLAAGTYFGARHGLETLSQLFGYDELRDCLMLHSSAFVIDQPEYVHRGLLIDTSRNFISLKALRSVVDGMSYNKLNVLHWHITDTHSFPFVSHRVPQLSKYGSYAPHKTYTIKEIQEFVAYARVRGVKVLPEFDAPAHVGYGWEFGPQAGLGDLVLCVNKHPWNDYCVEPPCGQLNPLNPQMYEVLGELYKDLFEAFEPVSAFHMGGDEINLNCWNSSAQVSNWMEAQGLNASEADLIRLWTHFQGKAQKLAYEANGGTKLPLIIWTSRLTEQGEVEQHVNKDDYVIQIWTTGEDNSISDVINKGYKTIFSNYDAWYLDCGSSSWIGEGNNWCSPYKGWQKVYDNSPRGLYRRFPDYNKENEESILGGEACMWTEQVDETTLPGKLWPRGSALGERLWSDPYSNWQDAEARMLSNRFRMVKRGIPSNAHQPEWCHRNEGLCRVE
eukprot:TRINITY_DN1548_c0_g1_i2.p1 TRINITY_DN1548_c0_g1~~TRINITY_DN1548_c0_g1_i2.p1  ORF type:complete len:625 (-),score=121.67 TRINITY_DN1548_c0_g1_i2:79-1749(-)